MATFTDIKTILNKAMAASKANIGGVDLAAKHREASFPNLYGEFTNAELKAGMARTLRLIQPETIPAPGAVGTRGEEANIVLALRGKLKLIPPVRQMPGGGPAVPDSDIATIVDWINHGCPD